MACEGPIEGIVSSLISSTSFTLHSHTSAAMASCSRKTPTTTPSHPSQPNLSVLYNLWSSGLPTLAVVLTTTVLLEFLLLKAVQDVTTSKGRTALDDLAKEVNASFKVILNLLQGRTVSGGIGDEKVNPASLPTIQSEESQMYMDSTVAVRASASNVISGTDATRSSSELSDDGQDHRRSPLIPSTHRTSRLRKIAFVLYSYKQKIHRLHQLVASTPASTDSLLKSPCWNSMLHFEWLTGKKECVISALDVSVVKDSSYSETIPFLYGSVVEKKLHMILQTIECGSNVLLTGTTVSLSCDVNM